MSTIKASKHSKNNFVEEHLKWKLCEILCLWMKDSIKSFNFISIFFVKYTLPIPMVHTSTWQVPT